VSTSGWWEIGNFGTVLRIVKELAEDASVEFGGALLRPHAAWLAENKEKAEEIFEAARQVGYQLVTRGKMPPNLLNTISQPLTSKPKWWR
jgi:hypothetical protein